ncbi:Hypoticical protein [Pectobacterium parmentieri]|uniref:Hypoticical protein n=1 Tax=Pectobacterium parmentieri TaxID=1905730 RepID=A0A0H3HY69_PECPM|nr:Hypoticical protein [Pectobacterium parmentieri]POW29442.1 hypothetical protein PB20LOC_00832 [Pectobacterium parmentieri]
MLALHDQSCCLVSMRIFCVWHENSFHTQGWAVKLWNADNTANNHYDYPAKYLQKTKELRY